MTEYCLQKYGIDEKCVTGDADPNLAGYGYLHTPEELRFILETPRSSSLDLRLRSDTDFQNLTLTRPRLGVLTPPCEKVYLGGWYNQSKEPTCAPWSVFNALMVLGIRPDLDGAAQFLNSSLTLGKLGDGGAGSNRVEIEQYLDEYHKDQVSINYLSLSGVGRDKVDYITKYEEKGVTTSFEKDEFLEKTVRVFQKEAETITKLFNSGYVFIRAVNTKHYSGQNDGGHAICLSGYKVDEEGRVDIQVIDSARGVIWISLEHLLQTSGETLLIGKL